MKVACICGRPARCRHGSFVEADGRLIMKSIAMEAVAAPYLGLRRPAVRRPADAR